VKIIRNKTIIGIFCILIGLAVGFVLLPKAQEQQEAIVQAVRVRQDVAAGMKIESSMLEVVMVPERAVPSGSVSTADFFLSRYAAIPLKAGDYMTRVKVRDTLVDPVAAAAAKGKQLVSITLPNFAAGVAGSLMPGDVVAIMVTTQEMQTQEYGINPYVPIARDPDDDDEEEDEASIDDDWWWADPDVNYYQPVTISTQMVKVTAIPEELKYLEVCKTTASDGTDAVVNRAKVEEGNRLPTTITFYVTESQALKLAALEQDGKIHITFLARGKDADVYIPASERVLSEGETPDAKPEPTKEPQPTKNPDLQPDIREDEIQPTQPSE